MAVAMLATCNVSHSGPRSSRWPNRVIVRRPSTRDGVTVFLDHRARLRSTQKVEIGLGHGLVFTELEQDGALVDGRVVRLRHHPPLPLACADGLRQRDKARLRITGGDEVEGLADVRPFDDLRFERVIYAHFFHRLDRRCAVGRGLGVCDGYMREIALAQDLLALFLYRQRGAVEHERAARIDEIARRQGQTVFGQRGRGGVVSRQQDVEWRAVANLRGKLPSGAEGVLHLVAGLGLERRADFLGGLFEVGRHRHGEGFGLRACRQRERQDEREPGSAQDSDKSVHTVLRQVWLQGHKKAAPG